MSSESEMKNKLSLIISECDIVDFNLLLSHYLLKNIEYVWKARIYFYFTSSFSSFYVSSKFKSASIVYVMDLI